MVFEFSCRITSPRFIISLLLLAVLILAAVVHDQASTIAAARAAWQWALVAGAL